MGRQKRRGIPGRKNGMTTHMEIWNSLMWTGNSIQFRVTVTEHEPGNNGKIKTVVEVWSHAMQDLVVGVQEFRFYLQGHSELLKGSYGGNSPVKSLKGSYEATEGWRIPCRGQIRRRDQLVKLCNVWAQNWAVVFVCFCFCFNHGRIRDGEEVIDARTSWEVKSTGLGDWLNMVSKERGGVKDSPSVFSFT